MYQNPVADAEVADQDSQVSESNVGARLLFRKNL